jgi:hypothetical protein
MAHTDYMHSFGAKYLKYKQRVIKILEVERFHHRYILKEGEWMTAIFLTNDHVMTAILQQSMEAGWVLHAAIFLSACNKDLS